MANVALGCTLIVPLLLALVPFKTLAVLFLVLPLLLFLALISWATFSLYISYILARKGTSPEPPRVPPLAFTTPAAWSRTLTRHKWDLSPTTNYPPLHPSVSPPVQDAISELITLAITNFVRSWHQELTGTHPAPSLAFPNAIESTIRFSLSRLLERAEGVDWPSLGVNRLVPKVTAHLAGYRAAQNALRGRGGGGGGDELDLLVANRYASETSSTSSLHAAVNVTSLNSRLSEEAWWRTRIEAILRLVMPEKETKSQPVMIMAREIVVCTVIVPLMETLADPDFWNTLIDEKVCTTSHVTTRA
jgi:sorting nexin-25